MPSPNTIASPAEQRVLVVDDEHTVRLVIGTLLDGLGIAWIAATFIAEARAAIDDAPTLDVAVVDKNLPDGVGLELIPLPHERHPGCALCAQAVHRDGAARRIACDVDLGGRPATAMTKA